MTANSVDVATPSTGGLHVFCGGPRGIGTKMATLVDAIDGVGFDVAAPRLLHAAVQILRGAAAGVASAGSQVLMQGVDGVPGTPSTGNRFGFALGS